MSSRGGRRLPLSRPLLLPSLLAWSIFTANVAAAQTSPPPASPPPEDPSLLAHPPSGDFRPHRGLYLNAQVGPGDLRVTSGSSGVSGRSTRLGMAIGIAAASNLVVYGEGYYARISSGYTTDLKSELGLGGFGAGVKYYLIPSNLFISSSLLLSKLVRSDAQPHHSELDETSYWGPVGRFSVGREWWVSPNWSFGLAGEIMLGRMRNYLTSSDNPSYYTVKGGALLLSSSFSAPPSKASHERLPGGGPGLPVDSAGVVSDAPVQAHQGFHLNVRLGGGYFGVSGPQEVSGLGTPIGLSIGFALKRNLILFGEYAWLLVTDPSSGYDYLARLDLRGFGPGLKYYLPLNLFFSGSLLLSQFSFNGIAFRYGVDMTSQWGASVRLAAGHEWLISSHWGLGVACELLLGRMRQAAAWTPGDPAPWYSATGVSVLASASFN